MSKLLLVSERSRHILAKKKGLWGKHLKINDQTTKIIKTYLK
jgi:hypothetical protein